MQINIEKNIPIVLNRGKHQNNKYNILLESLNNMDYGDSFVLSNDMIEAKGNRSLANFLIVLIRKVKELTTFKISYSRINETSVRIWKLEADDRQ